MPTYDVTHKKPETQNQNFFSLPTRRLAKSFEGLNSSLLAQLAESYAVAKTHDLCLISRYDWYACSKSVK